MFTSLGYCEDFRRQRQSSLAWRRRVCRDHATYINCVAVPSLLKPALNFQAFLGYSGLFSPRMDCRFLLPVNSPPPLTSHPRVNLTRIWQTSPLNWEGLMCVNVLPKDIMCVCFFFFYLSSFANFMVTFLIKGCLFLPTDAKPLWTGFGRSSFMFFAVAFSFRLRMKCFQILLYLLPAACKKIIKALI